MWVLGGEYEMSAIEASCIPCFISHPFLVRSRRESYVASTAVVFAIVRYHEHDLPFEDVAPDETATYARNVLVALHQLELATQEPGGC